MHWRSSKADWCTNAHTSRKGNDSTLKDLASLQKNEGLWSAYERKHDLSEFIENKTQTISWMTSKTQEGGLYNISGGRERGRERKE